MQTHLVTSLQEYFGYPPLQKIDPNTQEIAGGDDHQPFRLGQAIIPTAIVGIARFLSTEQGLRSFRSGETYPNWGSRIFGRNNIELCKRIADYSNLRWEEVTPKMHEVIDRAFWMIRSKGIVNDDELRNFIEHEKNLTLIFLPATLKLGELLGNDALDDRTHKMEGPVSNFIKKLGGSFDSAEQKSPDDSRN